MAKLFTDTGRRRVFPDGAEPLPDVLEAGVRLAGMRLQDAAAFQQTAAANSKAVRQSRGFEALPDGRFLEMKHPKQLWMTGTEERMAEFYAYARYLMGIDDYWLSSLQTIPVRMDYKIDAMLTPAPSVAVLPVLG